AYACAASAAATAAWRRRTYRDRRRHSYRSLQSSVASTPLDEKIPCRQGILPEITGGGSIIAVRPVECHSAEFGDHANGTEESERGRRDETVVCPRSEVHLHAMRRLLHR